MAPLTTADLLIEKLQDWGVDTVFGMPGDGINGIMEALRTRQEAIRFIQVRHEETAAFMACGYAKYTGKLGVCLATSGPGGIHLLNGLYDAKMDGQSVLAITGLQFHDLIGTRTQQDVELDRLFVDVTEYNARVMGPAHIENVVDLACRTALAKGGVAHITLPVDVQSQEATREGSPRNVPFHSASVFARNDREPTAAELRDAAAVLDAGDRVAILAGRGALGASTELEQIAEILGAPVAKALLGKAALPDDSPYTTGGIGLLGTAPSVTMMEECDTLLIIGSSFPYIEFYPKPGQARAVQIDIDPTRIGLRYPAEVGLVGDVKATLSRLITMLKRHESRAFLDQAQEGMGKWRALIEERGTRTDHPMKPQVVAWELGKRLADNAIVSGDSGTITTWWARQIPAKAGQMHSVSGAMASMANGLPYAMAAQLAYPDRQCVAFVGDGGFSMLMADFVTCVKHDLPVKVVVVKNDSLGQIKWEQMVFLGNPEYACDLQPIDFAVFARACGATGLTVDRAQDCGATLEEALRARGPVLVEAIVDPHEPPMPPKTTLDQTVKLAKSLMRGTPDRDEIAATIVRDRIRELI